MGTPGAQFFDWSISLGNILTIMGFAITAIILINTIRNKVDTLAEETKEIKGEMKKLVEILVAQARFEGRLDGIDGRLAAQGQRVDDVTRKIDAIYRIPGSKDS